MSPRDRTLRAVHEYEIRRRARVARGAVGRGFGPLEQPGLLFPIAKLPALGRKTRRALAHDADGDEHWLGFSFAICELLLHNRRARLKCIAALRIKARSGAKPLSTTTGSRRALQCETRRVDSGGGVACLRHDHDSRAPSPGTRARRRRVRACCSNLYGDRPATSRPTDNGPRRLERICPPHRGQHQIGRIPA